MAARVRYPFAGDTLLVVIERCKDGLWWNGAAFAVTQTPLPVALNRILPGLVGAYWTTPVAVWPDGEYVVYPCLLDAAGKFLAVDGRYSPARLTLVNGDDGPPAVVAAPGVTFVIPAGSTIVQAAGVKA